jgi:simple sugar transport system ATP-binding protein
VSAVALALHDIHKRFGAAQALAGASCVVKSGSVHALLGENGAGKTTLMRVAFGMLQPDRGSIERDGRSLRLASERDAIAAGIGMVHQHFMLVPAFTVAENAALGGRGAFDGSRADARVRRISEETGLPLDPQAIVASLPVGAQQRAEIVRALAHDARVMILDEPTAVLTPGESEELYAWMRRFVSGGGSVVLITHKLREALAVADDVTVLRRGKTVLSGASRDLSEESVVQAIVGEAPAVAVGIPLAATDDDVVFGLDGVSYDDASGVRRLKPTTVTVRRGEILGVLGVEGSGQRELLRLFAGRLQPSSGTVRRPPVVGFVPEDRLHDAVVPEFTLTENKLLAEASALRGMISWRDEGEAAARIMRDNDVRAGDANAEMRTLSGGNQQRFVVGRERRLAPDALVAENPTRGLDVQATSRVMAALRAVASDQRGAVIVHSADLDEILALTTRVVVCFAGELREIPPPATPGDRGPYARALVGAFA